MESLLKKSKNDLKRLTKHYCGTRRTNNNSSTLQLKQVIDQYKKTYTKTSIAKLDDISLLGLSGVPFYAWCFKGYNVTDLKPGSDYVRWTEPTFKHASYYERYHVGEYFNLPIFHKNLLKTTEYDHIMYGIVSVMLKWDAQSLYKFANEYLNGSTKMINLLLEERDRDNRQYLYRLLPETIMSNLDIAMNNVDSFYLTKLKNFDYDEDDNDDFDTSNNIDDDYNGTVQFINNLHEIVYTCEVPFLMSTIKILKCWFLEEDPVELKLLQRRVDVVDNSSVLRSEFNWIDTLDRSFVAHLKEVYSWILEDSFDEEKIKIIEADYPIPYQLPNISDDLEKLRGSSNFKFITGQACCGKTTMLNHFRKLGWKIYNRGKLGSFGGKANDPATIANLHAALQYQLTQSDVIGDRGSIDNPLWSFIMPACNPQRRDSLVGDLLSFINSSFNEPSIAEYITQKGVIFLDPYSRLNQERMLKRCAGGDPNRGRLSMYNPPQFMSYYTVARLFGWKCYAVPYTKERIFNPDGYKKIAVEVEKIFGPPKSTGTPFVWYNKPKNDFIIDNTYPKSVGIFK